MIPEILAPAGNYEAFLGAIENGADAVYLGGPEFNARYHADNFTEDDLRRALEYAHVRGRRVYVTLNILLDDRELPRALDYAFFLQELGVDAVIVQDLGFLQALNGIFAGLRIHASTQMTVHNGPGVKALEELGVKRVVLARELGFQELREIRTQRPDTELEVFVHGALCYSYSGQCLLSSVAGGRSGNRGRCAQPCRLRYGLLEEGRPVAAGHLLSPADLSLLSELPDLVKAGVDSLKIEGRMKRPEYVAVVTRVFRRALSRWEEYLAGGRADEWAPESQEYEDLEAIFNRTLTTGHWRGRNLKVLCPDRPGNRGVPVGQVIRKDPRDKRADIRLDRELRRGDGIEIRGDRQQGPAAIVENMAIGRRPVEKANPGDIISIEAGGACGPGDQVFRTHDKRLLDEAWKTIAENRPENRVPISVQVRGRAGEPLRVVFAHQGGCAGGGRTEALATKARNRPLSREDIIDKLGRLGNTPWKPISWDFDLAPDLMIPFSELNEVRRKAGRDLLAEMVRAAKPPSISREVFTAGKSRVLAGNEAAKTGSPVRLSVRVSDIKTARGALEAGADRVYLSFLGLKGASCPGQELAGLRRLARELKRELYFEVPAILKPGDEFEWADLLDLAPDGVLAGSLGAVRRLRGLGLDLHADYSLNIFNRQTIRVLASQGVSGVCLSPELNRTQLRRMIPSVLPTEYIVHGRMAVMVSEHCLMGNQGLCSGNCQLRERTLKDDRGYVFPLAADRYCRMHLFNSRTTCLIDELPELAGMGLGFFRIEALLDSAEQVARTVGIYREALDLAGKTDLSRLRGELEAFSPSPLTRLHLRRGVQ